MAPKRELSDKFIDDADASEVEEDSAEASGSGSETEKKPKKKPAKKAAPKKSPPKKKVKAKKGSDDEDDDDLGEGSSGGLETNKDGDSFVSLGPQKRITIRKYKGSVLIDIRETYSKDGVDGLPGKKGISLTKDQFDTMKASISLIEEAIDSC